MDEWKAAREHRLKEAHAELASMQQELSRTSEALTRLQDTEGGSASTTSSPSSASARRAGGSKSPLSAPRSPLGFVGC